MSFGLATQTSETNVAAYSPLRYSDSHEMAIANWKNQTIWTGDNLLIMRGMDSESVDLIYLDPPWNSKKDYAMPIGTPAAGADFKDIWNLSDLDVAWVHLIKGKHPRLYRVVMAAMRPSDKSYLIYMAVRLLEMHRLLKRTGSIYLHCDPTMSHYLKACMDAVFGWKNFRNEIIQERLQASQVAKHQFSREHMVILFYSKKKGEHTFNRDEVRRGKEELAKSTKKERGRGWGKDGEFIRIFNWDAPGVVENRERWRSEGYKFWDGTHLTNHGRLRGSVWTDSKQLGTRNKERVGHLGQKDLNILRRIILASSNKGEVVLDPFCGCGTTCIAAEELGRRWTGIDLASKAVDLLKFRFKDEIGLLYKGAERTDIPLRVDHRKILPYRHKSNLEKLYGQQGGDCNGCGYHDIPQRLEVDHIIAKTKGGTDHIENLQLLCSRCNRLKGSRSMEYLKVQLQIN